MASPEDSSPPATGLTRPLRILIVRIGAMGDVLHAMPAVAALRDRHPEMFLAWAIEPQWSSLLGTAGECAPETSLHPRTAARPLVDRVISVSTKRWKRQPLAASTRDELRSLLRELRQCDFDLCIDLQGSIKSALVGRMAHAKLFAGPANPRERQAAWLYGERIAVHSRHVVEQACELIAGAVAAATGEAAQETLRPARAALPFDQAAERWCDATLAELAPHGERFVLIAPAAGWGAKQWPASRFGALAAILAQAGFPVLVNAASFGDAVALGVVEASGDAARLIPCPLEKMISLVRRASLVVAGDTGPLHLAAALGRPVVALFGPTDPARNGPFATTAIVLRHPSSRQDHQRHAKTDSGLLQIEVAEVADAALKLLQDGQDKLDR